MPSAEELRRQASFARMSETNRALVLMDLGQAIAALDRVDDLIGVPDHLGLRRQLVNFYLDLLAIRLRPFDQAEDEPNL